MGVSSAVFESAGLRTEHYVPGTYSRSSVVSSPAGVSSGNLAILGDSTGGEPYKLYEFGSLAEAKEKLVGGDLLTAISYAYSGSSYIPQKVFAMRTNPGTQASLTLKDGANADCLILTTADYGTQTNQIKFQILEGTDSNTLKYKVTYKSDEREVDNIGRIGLSITYAGESETVTAAVNQNSLVLVDGAETKTFDFDTFSTLSELEQAINDLGNFSATVEWEDSDASASTLDTMGTTAITSTGIKLYCNRQAMIDALEGCSYIGKVEIPTGSVTRVAPATMDTPVYFAGATTSASSVETWTQALTELSTKDIQIVTTPSSDSSVHTLIASHCREMSSTTNRKERMCLLGGGIGETDETAIAKAKAFNSELVSYVVDNATITNTLKATTETISGAMLAVILAAMESAVTPSVSLTYKSINVLGFTKTRTLTNMEKLIKAGIIVCNPAPEDAEDYVVIRAVTTYQKASLIDNERSMTREKLFMDRDLRAAFRPLIGKSGGITQNTVINTVRSKGNEWAKANMIVPSDSGEYVWNITVDVVGDKIYLTFSRYLTAPVNFVFITAINEVYTSTVEL